MAISESEQSNIVKLVVGMFDAAPGSAVLAEVLNVFEANDHDYAALATVLASTGAFQSLYAPALSSDEFAAAFLGTLGLAGNEAAHEFVVSKAESGESRGLIVLDALVALASTSAPEFEQAKAVLNEKTEAAAHYSMTQGTAPVAMAALQNPVFDASSVGGSTFTGLAVSGDLGADATVNGTGFAHGLTVTGSPGGWDLTVGFTGTGGGADSLAIAFNDEAQGNLHTLAFGTLKVDGIESFNIASGGSDPGDTNQIGTLSGDAMSVITVTGGNAFDLLGLSDVTADGLNAFTRLDASSASGDNIFVIGDRVAQQTAAVEANVSYVVVLGSGDDVVELASAAGNGAATSATIDVSGGGRDLIKLASFFAATADVAAAATGSIATIVGADAGDMLDIADVTSAARLGAAQNVGGAVNVAQAADIAVAAAGANDIAWFTLGGNTYIAVDAGGDNAFTSSDQLIKLLGAHDLSAALYAGGVVTLVA